MVQQVEITLPEYKRGFHIITGQITKALNKLPQKGLLHILIKHTSAALTINENADFDVLTDMEVGINRLAPEEYSYLHHSEGLDDMPAHLKASLMGASLTIPITDSKLNLGTWQGIYLCEFRNYAGRRKLVATIVE